CDDSTHSDYVLFSNYQTHDRTNRRYCGQVCPKNSIVSESNYFRMMFRSNDIFDATGFYAHYQFITERWFQPPFCIIINAGTFSSLLRCNAFTPDFPDNYKAYSTAKPF
ncbi:unnamed protein product, partial [Gongylonema pulchrum]|uniref:CUB domain-containing protein n=1 Tax=Gongylonema pulchrum TaxID=637853 RepID=A0A183DHP1_9BILA